MVNFEEMGAKGEHLGDFATGSKGESPLESLAQEQARQEKSAQDLEALVSELKTSGREVLGSYVNALTPDQISKIDQGLNIESKGIVDLKWVGPEQQNEIMGLLGEVDQAQDRVAVENACKRIANLLDNSSL